MIRPTVTFAASVQAVVLSALAAIQSTEAALISAGNLMIYRVGSGDSGLSSAATAVFIDQYTTEGKLLRSIPVPAYGDLAMTAVGHSSTEGMMTTSMDGTRIVFGGYRKDAGGTTPSLDSPALTNRVIGMLSNDGSIDTSFSVSNITGSIRSAVSFGPTGMAYVGTSSALQYISDLSAASTATVIESRPTRQVIVSSGILFASNGSTSTTAKVRNYGVAPHGPTSATAVVTLPFGEVVNGIWFADLNSEVPGDDTIYFIRPVVNQLSKQTFDGTEWRELGSVSLSEDSSISNLTGAVGSDGVDLYMTAGQTLYGFKDTGGYSAVPSGNLRVLATASPNTAFRGIAIMQTAAPVPESAPSTALLLFGTLLVHGDRRRAGQLIGLLTR
jgi:hypothetical protein